MAKGISSWGFISMLVVGCLCVVANAIPGGIEDVPNFQQNKEIQELAKYAVNEHNKEKNTGLSLSKVVKAQQQVVAGMKYYLTLEVFSDGKPKLYRAVIYVKPWQNYKELQEFTPVKE